MTQKRCYPLFLIDSVKSENYPHDYIVCLDKEYGFVAQVWYYCDRNLYDVAVIEWLKSGEQLYIAWFDTHGIIIVIIDMLNIINPTADQLEKIKVLFKKAVKKYIVISNINTNNT